MITLTKPETAVVWRSTDVGKKFTNIPGSSSFNNGYELIVKTPGLGDTHTIIPDSGTIGGEPSLTVIDNGGSVHVLSDGANHDWANVCICTNSKQGFGVRHIAIGGATGDLYFATTDTPPGPIHTTITTNPFYITVHGIFDQIAEGLAGATPTTQNKLIAYVYSECLPPPTGLAAAPAVSSVFDDQGLVWNLRSVHTALLPSVDCGRDQNIRFETWWADCSGLPDRTTVNVSATFITPAFVPHLIVNGIYNGGDWDTSVDVPASIVTTSSDMLPSFPMPTVGEECIIFLWYMTADRAVLPLVPRAIQLYTNPYGSGLFFGSQLFFNLNQTGVGGLEIHINSAGQAAQTTGSLGSMNLTFGDHGAPTWVRFSGLTPPKWRSIGGGQQLENNRAYVITDASGVHFFALFYALSNLTGMTEPIWDTSRVGATTIDNGYVWRYIGTSFSIAPYYTALPKWDTPMVGGGYSPPGSIADSGELYNFTKDSSTPIDGVTGMTEPTWNSSGFGALTTDGTVIWRYIGAADPSQFVVPPLLVTVDVMDRK